MLRIPGIRDNDVPPASMHYSSKTSKWLEDEHLIRDGTETDWKKQYKLRHNWSRGKCVINEIQIDKICSLHPTLVQLHNDVVITAEKCHGLRAWAIKGSRGLFATLLLNVQNSNNIEEDKPASLAIDTSQTLESTLNISIGFSNGKLGIYTLDKQTRYLCRQYMHHAMTGGAITAIAYSSPYLLAMTEAEFLLLYSIVVSPTEISINRTIHPPILITSLKSCTAWPPISISIRAFSQDIVASVAYTLPTSFSGWSIGLQEFRLSSEGTIILSRLTSTAGLGLAPRLPSSNTTMSNSKLGLVTTPESPFGPPFTRPTCLSYCHPYLLVSHSDNTLTSFLVQSTGSSLIIGTETRLWGHTSSVSGAHVGNRGRAVSVSAHGEEVRVWDLESGIRSKSFGRRIITENTGIHVRPYLNSTVNEISKPPSSLIDEMASKYIPADEIEYLSTTEGWVGVNNEKLVVLRGKHRGSQTLVMYDFS